MDAVFLDLDGTLIDPEEGITGSIRYALEELGAEVPEASTLRWCIGPPLWSSFEVLLGPGADIEEAVRLYRERYTSTGMFEAEVYDGVGEMLEDLRDLEASLWIVTSKPEIYARQVISSFGIDAYVDGLFGTELTTTDADKTPILARAIEEAGAEPSRSAMLGDRRFDINAARNMGVLSVGALWGFAEDGELHLAEADVLAGAPEDVASILEDLMEQDT